MRNLAAVATIALTLATGSEASADSLLGEWSGLPGEPFFGTAVSALDDVDGDGTPDVLVGDPSGGGYAGRVAVFSGGTGERLFEASGATPGQEYGAAVVGLGDTNGDAIPDFAVGAPLVSAAAPGAGQVTILSGEDGALLLTLDGSAPDSHYGSALARVPDLDGDGIDDLAVGAPREGGDRHGTVRVHSSASGALLLLLEGDGADDFFGTSVCAAGDLDGDTVADLFVGAPQAGLEAGYARVLSGADGSVLREFSGDGQGDAFGFSVAALGDVDFDMTPDFAIGVPGLDLGFPEAGGVLVLSGNHGNLLHLQGGDEIWARFGFSLAGVGDVDDDGVADVAMGTDRIAGGEVRIWRGSDGKPVVTLPAFEEGAESLGSGVAVAAAGDLDGDGVPDVLMGVPTRLVSADPGRVVAVRVAFDPWLDLGSGLVGSTGTPLLEGQGSLDPGTGYTIRLDEGVAFGTATLVVGLKALDAPFKGGVFVPNPDVLHVGLGISADGMLIFNDALPLDAEPGSSVIFQVWVEDPGGPQGMAASNALQATIPF
jgi:hypothetical protein